MARLPDRFDLFVRKAKACSDPARQADYVLGALAALPAWYFLNIGPGEKVQLAESTYGGNRFAFIFSDGERANEMAREKTAGLLSIISIPQPGAMEWCVKLRTGLLVNAQSESCMVPFDQLEAFLAEWTRRGEGKSAGFWIPNMTTEEEDFWQEYGL